MTTQSHKKAQGQVFVKAKDAQRTPKSTRTDAEIRADMKASVKRNASTLKILAKL